MTQQERIFTTLSPTRLFFRCALPSMVSMAVTSLYTVVDGIFVGRYVGAGALAAVIAAYNYQGPVYLRFSRLATPVFHDPETYEFEIGKGEKLTDGYDIAVISTGLMTNEALRAAVLTKRQGMNVRVINMPTIKPIDEEIILTAARECGRIITVEEHSVIGGLGEAVCSVVSEKLPVPVRRIGVMDQFGHSGPANEVLRDYGLTADNIVNVIRDIVRPDAKA